jgi:hypothetical protein
LRQYFESGNPRADRILTILRKDIISFHSKENAKFEGKHLTDLLSENGYSA